MIARHRFSRIIALTVLTTAVLVGVLQAQASAAALWNLDIHHDQTNFTPGGTAELAFDIRNLGSTASSGTTTLHVTLPDGITRSSYRLDLGTINGESTEWECPGSAGDSDFTCTTTNSIVRGADVRSLLLTVAIAPNAAPNLVVTATLSGGGAPEAPSAANCEPGVGACASEQIHVSEEPAPFGMVQDAWVGDFYEPNDVTPVRQAGAHPGVATFSFDLNSIEGGLSQALEIEKIPSGSLRNVQVELPPGFVGNPTAVGECEPAELSAGACPASSQVGRVDVSLQAGSGATSRYDISEPIYNMHHPRGAVTDLGFVLVGKVVHIKASLDPANNYAIEALTPDINETDRVMNTRVTIWGIPGDPSHESERHGGAYGLQVKPFLTVPDRCEGSEQMVLSHYDSWQNSGVFGPPVTYDMPGQFTGCERPQFNPDVSVEPTEKQAGAPTGLNVRVHVPQNENPNGYGTPPVKDTTVTLPEGMSFSPSFANGLTSCPLAEVGLGTNDPVGCADSSRIGEVTLQTPLLQKQLEGSIYLAAQYDNPFGSLFALYLVLHDNEERGILIKLAGKIETDSVTGQITTTFADTPQLPFEDLTLKFRSGPRAPLVNPAFCGTQSINAHMDSWAQPNNPVDISGTYQITEGANGPCPTGGTLAFNPGLVAGTLDNVAGSYSPLNLRMTRNDGEQEITGFASTLPPGLTANLNGVPFCPETAIAIAKSKTGAQEEAEPSCPVASQIGHTIAEAGVGGTLAQAPGKLYMGGAFQGAPFSIVSITSAKVGPYDLGTVVVHLPLSIDLHTADVNVGSGEPDQIPHIIKGVIVHLRNIRVYVDRPNFSLNPTSCEHLTFSATVIGSGQNYVSPTDDVPVTVTNPFQAADCSSLKFTPSFHVTAGSKASRTNGVSVKFNVAYPKDALGTQSWFHAAKFTIPRQLPARLTTLQQACAAATFERNPAACPIHAVIGHATVHTQILPVPLEGPIYFVSHGGEKFPDVVLVLQGYGITVDLTGQTFISKAGVTSATFHSTPDVPFESIEVSLPAGPFSEFGANLPHNSQNFCGQKLVVPTAFTASNGQEIHQNTPVSITNCPKSLTNQQKLKAAIAACHKKHGKKRTSCERTAHKRYAATKAKKRK